MSGSGRHTSPLYEHSHTHGRLRKKQKLEETKINNEKKKERKAI
jgi:hypothetical protein